MDFLQNNAMWLIGAFAGLCLLVALVKRKSTPRVDVVAQEERERLEYERLPKCVCGELAVFPAPVLKRTRGGWDWLRTLFAAPPRYTRYTDNMGTPVFCKAHVHVADAEMDKFIFSIRSDSSALNAKIASAAAGFEQESLIRLVAESLTETQKRATRKSNVPVRLLPVKTGSEDGE